MVIVRTAVTVDVEPIVRMGLRFIAETSYRGALRGATAELLTPFVKMSIAQGTCLVAEDRVGQDARLVGFIVAVVLNNPFTGIPFVDELAWWMEPEHRGGRAAYKMLRGLVEWAGQNGVPTLKMVAPAGTQVGAFYERLGFKAVETSYTLDVEPVKGEG